MIEIVREAEGTLDKPQCWNLPEKRSYWCCRGTSIKPKRKWFHKSIPQEPVWRYLHYTRDEAEASASRPSPTWKWDKMPAKQIELSEALGEVRVDGDLGIRVKSYQDGKWVIVKEYPCGVPLPDWELE